jgi:hypothetical protein
LLKAGRGVYKFGIQKEKRRTHFDALKAASCYPASMF